MFAVRTDSDGKGEQFTRHGEAAHLPLGKLLVLPSQFCPGLVPCHTISISRQNCFRGARRKNQPSGGSKELQKARSICDRCFQIMMISL